jgi:putative heme iron utilization protein
MQSLHHLLWGQRVAALGTLSKPSAPNDPAHGTHGTHGTWPAVSMVPYAIDSTQQALVVHVSALAAHTQQMEQHPDVGLLVSSPEVEGQPVHALERISLQAHAHTPERESAAWHSAHAAYTARFPEAAFMTALGDFRFVLLSLTSGRHVAGFGAARQVAAEELVQLLSTAPAAAAGDR